MECLRWISAMFQNIWRLNQKESAVLVSEYYGLFKYNVSAC